jgi:hypothetical protein
MTHSSRADRPQMRWREWPRKRGMMMVTRGGQRQRERGEGRESRDAPFLDPFLVGSLSESMSDGNFRFRSGESYSKDQLWNLILNYVEGKSLVAASGGKKMLDGEEHRGGRRRQRWRVPRSVPATPQAATSWGTVQAYILVSTLVSRFAFGFDSSGMLGFTLPFVLAFPFAYLVSTQAWTVGV